MSLSDCLRKLNHNNGLRHVLKRSGWRLCEGTAAVAELDALPLPAAHVHLGPMTLRDTLVTLAGSAWELRLDERARQVCFVATGDMPDDAPDIGVGRTRVGCDLTHLSAFHRKRAT